MTSPRLPYIVRAALDFAATNEHRLAACRRGELPTAWQCRCGAFIWWRLSPPLMVERTPEKEPLDLQLIVDADIERQCRCAQLRDKVSAGNS